MNNFLSLAKARLFGYFRQSKMNRKEFLISVLFLIFLVFVVNFISAKIVLNNASHEDLTLGIPGFEDIELKKEVKSKLIVQQSLPSGLVRSLTNIIFSTFLCFLSIKRLNDIGISRFWAILALVPAIIVRFPFVIYLTLKNGKT